MELWQIWAIVGAILIVLEIFTPTMLFLNFALACFVTALGAVYTDNMYILLSLWIVMSALFIIFLRPLLLKKNQDKNSATGMDKYIGKKAKALEDISKDNGTISIFDERWNARCTNAETIPTGSIVVIEHFEDLTMYVKKEK